MATQIQVYNLALILLENQPVSSITQNNRALTQFNAVWDKVRRSELAKHPWRFAIQMVQLQASGTPPLFDRANAYPLPGDFLAMAPRLPEDNYPGSDWQIQGTSVISRDDAPINVRYVADMPNPGTWDELFADVIAARLAQVCCGAINNSNSKQAHADEAYQAAMMEAKRKNAYLQAPIQFPIDPFEIVRL